MILAEAASPAPVPVHGQIDRRFDGLGLRAAHLVGCQRVVGYLHDLCGIAGAGVAEERLAGQPRGARDWKAAVAVGDLEEVEVQVLLDA